MDNLFDRLCDRTLHQGHLGTVLWRAVAKAYPTYERSQYDGWVLCPREHAQKHLRCIIEVADVDIPLWRLREIFERRQRFFEGTDLVFAVGDCQ